MKILQIPFFSQQDKTTGKFLLEKCCITQMNAFIARKLSDSGHDVAVTIPREFSTVEARVKHVSPFPSNVLLHYYDAVPDNVIQRLGFPIDLLSKLLQNSSVAPDLIISSHELLSPAIRGLISMRGLHTKIVQFNHLLPLGIWEWMKEAQVASWNAADLVATMGPMLSTYVNKYIPKNLSVVWPMAVDKAEALVSLSRRLKEESPEKNNRSIDLLFVQRCSENNYTRHKEFLQAVELLSERNFKARIVFTDPTHYLRNNLPNRSGIEFAEADTRDEYWQLLYDSKYAIAMMDNDRHGGIAIREAIAAGCVPITSRNPAYDEFYVGQYDPEIYRVKLPSEPKSIASTLLHVLGAKTHENSEVIKQYNHAISNQTYEVAWQKMVNDLTQRGFLKQ